MKCPPLTKQVSVGASLGHDPRETCRYHSSKPSGLTEQICFDCMYFESTCLKAGIQRRHCEKTQRSS